MKNPFFTEYGTPFNIAPFDKIKNEHFIPAFNKGIEEQNKEIEEIVNNPLEANFQNTIEAIEFSGKLITKVSSVFFNFMSANTSEELEQIANEILPKLTRNSDEIILNEQLFERVQFVHQKKDTIELTVEQKKLLEKTYKNFSRGGATLAVDKKEELKQINEELAKLTLQFGSNVLKETNRYKLIIQDKNDLEGLPESVIEAAAETSNANGENGKWIFTVQRPSVFPFLQYAKNRNLREQIFKAYINKGNNNDSLDNKILVLGISNLRIRRAQLLGYKSHTDYILEENMAKNPQNVYKLMNQVWASATITAKKEASEMQVLIDKEGSAFKLQAWDWWYYSEKLRKQKYDLDEELLRPYFKLENVRDAAFMVANRIFGIVVKEIKNVPKPHPEAESFEITEEDGSHIGILFMDFYPRESKEGGGWMNDYQSQHVLNGKDIRPIVTNVFNFTKPVGDKPALISFEEATTLFHEFGHALHSLLSKCKYASLSGTNVPQDFVELPSQLMENWASHPEMLKIYAKHYKTDEPIPDELIQKIKNSQHFNQGFETCEYLSAVFLDMNWHTLTETNETIDVNRFEIQTLTQLGLIPEIVVRYRSTFFNHIFSDPIGYSSGYYSYLWSEVLDADAFDTFIENGIFDRETGMKYRQNILEKGGTEDPMELYIKFKGSEPKTEALMKRKGFQ